MQLALGLLILAATIPNPAIEMPGYLRVAEKAAVHRAAHRVSEEEFIRIAAQPGAIILDASSAQKFGELHVRGAVNLKKYGPAKEA